MTEFFSECCDEPMNSEDRRNEICPKCKEYCDIRCPELEQENEDDEK